MSVGLTEYVVTPLPRERRFDPYRFAIWRDGRRVAEIRHSARGADFELRTNGGWVRCEPMFSGGGRLPLKVTAAGALLLDRLLDS